ncbi:MAG: Mur ligase family protein, partial [Pseudomarimonas sp.]
MQCALQWPASKLVVRRHKNAVSLAFPAPVDVLFTATEVNEWALLASMGVAALHAPGYPASWDEAAAVITLRAMERAERQPNLVAVLKAAAERCVSTLLDDDTLTIGAGRYSRSWPRCAPPQLADLDWEPLRSLPTTLVTGSNGKTTTVRLIAAMLRENGLRCGHSCTDGVMIDGQPVASGDYSGPAGARTVLRDPRVEAAVLETARGGLLRRGLAVEHASVAVVTNVSADHFGEYGIDDLAGLAEAKLTVARALGPEGTLVVNADDPHLVARASTLGQALAWFAQDLAHPQLRSHREQGGAICGVKEGQLVLAKSSHEYPLGEVAQLPLCAGGLALYNIGNCAAAALAAHAQGVPV